MEIATIKVNTVTACVECKKPIPRGLVGGTVRIHYADPIWKDLNKTVVFQGVVTRDVLNVTDTAEIPWETVAKAGKTLHIGFYGSNADGSIVVPTIWVELGMIQGAANPSGDLSAEPTPDVWEQMQAMIGNLGKLETQSKTSIVDAVNEAFTRGGTDLSAVKSVNGIFPDENGNVSVGDGCSPTVTLTDINGGVRVAVTDINGTANTDITATKIGAAPAGYGFGEPAEIAEVGSEEELFAFLEQMFQKCQEAGAKKVYIYARNQIGSIPATSCFMGNVYKFGTMVGGFTGYSYINGFAELSIQRYTTWQAIEWSNPPMVPGVEYRTTERHNGKPVFVKRIYTGYLDLPMNFIFLESTTEFIDEVVDLSYFITNKPEQGAMYTAHTYCQRNDLTIFFNNDVYKNLCEASVFMETAGSLSDYTGYVTVKYTKQSF